MAMMLRLYTTPSHKLNPSAEVQERLRDHAWSALGLEGRRQGVWMVWYQRTRFGGVLYRLIKECGIACPMMTARLTDGGRRGGFCQGVEVHKVNPVYQRLKKTIS
ncbi:hypothetical protein AO073_06065 [Pseudomonas syringae ICMP 11293]|nr:hypothetical protein AO073_06065 [Pseudomonas syringae ICMP 11293]